MIFNVARTSPYINNYLNLVRSLAAKRSSSKLVQVMHEYFKMEHAEPVPTADLGKDCKDTFYLPMYIVTKASSTTTKFCIVFDASAKNWYWVIIIKWPISRRSHGTLITGWLPLALSLSLDSLDSRRQSYVSCSAHPWDRTRSPSFRMERNWREPVTDYHMTRLTFGVSASPFAAYMAVKQNAIDFGRQYPQAARVVHESFYVDDGLMGWDTMQEVVELQRQLQELFIQGGLVLRKWKTSVPVALRGGCDPFCPKKIDFHFYFSKL